MNKLVSPSDITEREYLSLIAEFIAHDEKLVPGSLDSRGACFKSYIESLNEQAEGRSLPSGFVPSTTYFLYDENGPILGAVNIRHRLVDHIMIEGGNIGYGIRPSARKQGHGTTILGLALIKAKALGLDSVLITCNKNNVASARIILNNGGFLESEKLKDNKIFQQYRIKI